MKNDPWVAGDWTCNDGHAYLLSLLEFGCTQFLYFSLSAGERPNKLIVIPFEPTSNVQHIADQDLTKDEVEEVLVTPEHRTTRRSSGLPVVFGSTSTGRFIAVVFQEIDEETARPITAYDIEE